MAGYINLPAFTRPPNLIAFCNELVIEESSFIPYLQTNSIDN